MADEYDNLSEMGISQSVALGKYLRKEGVRFDMVYTGPLKRHYQTFEHCFAQLPKDQYMEPLELDGLKEHSGTEAMDAGFDQLEARFEEVVKWKKEMEDRPEFTKRNSLRIFRLFMQEWMSEKLVIDDPEILPFGKWRDGVRRALRKIINSIDRSETIGIFTSGGTIGAVLAEVLDIKDGRKIANFNDSTRNSSMSHFFYSSFGFNILSFNEIPHLTQEQITFV